MAKAKEVKEGWKIKCPICKTDFYLEECPIPGGLGNNIEICPECGAYIEVQP